MSDESSAILITGARVYDHDGDVEQPPVADILVEGSRIARIEPGLGNRLQGEERPAKVIDARGKLAVPGFVSAHYHSHDVLLKGSFETIPLDVWCLVALPPAYPKRSDEEVRARTLLGAAECMRGGITTVQDLLTIFPFEESHVDAAINAYDEIGIRTVFALQIADVPGLEAMFLWKEVLPPEFHKHLHSSTEPIKNRSPLDAAIEQYFRLKNASPRITWALGPSGPEYCSQELLEGVAAFSEEHDLCVVTHLYEHRMSALISRPRAKDHGGSILRYMQDLGLMGPRLSLAHCVWVTPDEIELLAETRANVVLNPVGNLKTKSGVAPIREYYEAGVALALGCDNCSCSDVQSMLQAMKQFTCLPSVSHVDPGPPTAADALRTATLGGATALGLDGRVGALRPGMQADVTLVDLSNPCFVPLNSAARQLVFGESGSGIETVIIDGRVVMEDRKLTTINEGELRDAVEVLMDVVRKDRDKRLELIDKMLPYLNEATRRSWAEDIGLDHRYVGGGLG